MGLPRQSWEETRQPLALPIALGDSGPNAAIVVAGAGLLGAMARLREWRFSFSALPMALLAFLTALFLSIGFAVVNSGLAIAAGSAARAVLAGLGIFVFFSAAQGPERADRALRERMTRALFWIACAAGLFGCVDFVLQLPAPAGFEPQFLWLDSGVYRRAQGLFYEASTLGNFCAFFVVMVAVALTGPAREGSARELRVPKWALWTALLVFTTAMLLSFSRASVLACGIELLTLAVVQSGSWKNAKALGALLAVTVLAVLALTFFLPEIAGGYWSRIVSIGTRSIESPDSVLSGRLESWRILTAFIWDYPWQTFFGIGYKTLPYTQYLGRPVVADNVYLGMLVECGVFGLGALLFLNAAILSASWRALQRGSFYGKWMFCFWVGEAFQMLSGDILTYWRVLPVYFWVLAQAFLDANESPADRSVL